jgi:hypothetical protein
MDVSFKINIFKRAALRITSNESSKQPAAIQEFPNFSWLGKIIII